MIYRTDLQLSRREKSSPLTINDVYKKIHKQNLWIFEHTADFLATKCVGTFLHNTSRVTFTEKQECTVLFFS